MPVAMELMCPGVPVTDCAIMRPPRSNTAAERSSASRTMGVNAVRISAAACSLVTEMSRCQRTCTTTGSRRSAIVLPSRGRLRQARRQVDDHVERLVDPRPSARSYDDRGFPLLDDRRALHRRARGQLISVEYRGVDESM